MNLPPGVLASAPRTARRRTRRYFWLAVVPCPGPTTPGSFSCQQACSSAERRSNRPTRNRRTVRGDPSYYHGSCTREPCGNTRRRGQCASNFSKIIKPPAVRPRRPTARCRRRCAEGDSCTYPSLLAPRRRGSAQERLAAPGPTGLRRDVVPVARRFLRPASES